MTDGNWGLRTGFAVACLFGFFTVTTSAIAQEGDMVWQYREAGGSAGVGRKSAGLIYGVPETDNVQLQAGCNSGPVKNGKSISLVLAADVGALTDGATIEVRFSGGRFKQSLDGLVHGTAAEEGITGAHIQAAPNDRLWQAMQERDGLDYQVAGYRRAHLKLRGGASTIQRFVAACDRFARLGGTPADQSSNTPATSNVRVAGAAAGRSGSPAVSEKDAFESAKELGTIEAWEAFLKSFPTGFRADLARAYVKRLAATGGRPTSKAAKSESTDGASAPALDTFESRPGVAPWRRIRYEMDEGNSSERAASVTGNGVELLFYCRGKRLTGIVRENGRGLYPNFDQRIEQGLAAKRRGQADGEPVPIAMEFSNGRRYSVGAHVMGLTGEVELSRRDDGRGFKADGSLIEDMMSRSVVTIAAAPFVANLQLKNSRTALCGLIKSCGARSEACGTAKKSYTTKKVYKKKPKKRSCRKGGASCSKNSQCCSGKCCLDDFEECEGWYGRCG